jgi:hypothetical protein
MDAKRVIISKDLARKLRGIEFTKGNTFNPFLDEDMNICISEQEINQITNEDFLFLKDLVPKEKDEILKDFKTEKEWIEHYKLEAEKEAQRLSAELEKIKPIKK